MSAEGGQDGDADADDKAHAAQKPIHAVKQVKGVDGAQQQESRERQGQQS